MTTIFKINKYLESPELLDLDNEVATLNTYAINSFIELHTGIDETIEEHTCNLITLILTKLKEIQDNEI